VGLLEGNDKGADDAVDVDTGVDIDRGMLAFTAYMSRKQDVRWLRELAAGAAHRSADTLPPLSSAGRLAPKTREACGLLNPT